MNAILDFLNGAGWGFIVQLITLVFAILKYFNVL